jgi:hypothetical protein
VKVVVIEPGGSPTAIWGTGEKQAAAVFADPRLEAYRPLVVRYLKLAQASARQGFPPERFAELVGRVLSEARPRARYVIPARAGFNVLLRRVLPDWAWDALIRRVFQW